MYVVKLQHFDTISNTKEDMSSHVCFSHIGFGMVKITSHLLLETVWIAFYSLNF